MLPVNIHLRAFVVTSLFLPLPRTMGQRSLIRWLHELETFPKNVLQYPKDMPGNWQKFFQNNHPPPLRWNWPVAGEWYTDWDLARLHLTAVCLGIDVKRKPASGWVQNSLKDGLAVMCNTLAPRVMLHKPMLWKGWGSKKSRLLFPDPRLRSTKHESRCPCTPSTMYQQFLPNLVGWFILKTDSPVLYQFTLEGDWALPTGTAPVSWRFYGHTRTRPEELKIKTHYEAWIIATKQYRIPLPLLLLIAKLKKN